MLYFSKTSSEGKAIYWSFEKCICEMFECIFEKMWLTFNANKLLYFFQQH